MSSQALEQIAEFAPTFGQTAMYGTIDAYAAGTIALYTPPVFRPASNFGMGPGIAREIPGTFGLVERFRIDDHKPFGPHINYEIALPGLHRKSIIDNHHIPY